MEQGRHPELPFSDFMAADAPLPPGFDALPSLSFGHSPGSDGPNHHSWLLGGSAGMGLRTGGLFIRPRIDVFFGPTRHNVSSWNVAAEFDVPGVGRQSVDLGTESLDVAVRPLFVLVGFDVGWSSRR